MVAGKSLPADGEGKCFAFVQTHDAKPKRRLFEALKSQGLTGDQQITFLTDGARTSGTCRCASTRDRSTCWTGST